MFRCLGLRIVSLKPSISRRLRFVSLADDTDHLIHIQIDQQISVEDLYPRIDRASDAACAAPAPRGGDPASTQHCGSDITSGVRVASSTFHVQRKTVSSEVARKQRLHQHFRLDANEFRFRPAGLPRCLIVHITEQRQFALFSNCAICRSASLLHLVRDFGDDDLQVPCLPFSIRHFCAQAKTARPSHSRQNRGLVLPSTPPVENPPGICRSKSAA